MVLFQPHDDDQQQQACLIGTEEVLLQMNTCGSLLEVRQQGASMLSTHAVIGFYYTKIWSCLCTCGLWQLLLQVLLPLTPTGREDEILGVIKSIEPRLVMKRLMARAHTDAPDIEGGGSWSPCVHFVLAYRLRGPANRGMRTSQCIVQLGIAPTHNGVLPQVVQQPTVCSRGPAWAS